LKSLFCVHSLKSFRRLEVAATLAAAAEGISDTDFAGRRFKTRQAGIISGKLGQITMISHRESKTSKIKHFRIQSVPHGYQRPRSDSG
jgi:hypothetical protein